MQFNSLQPFVPSGSDFAASKQLFQELGFNIDWDAGDCVGFVKVAARFILQQYDNPAFAQNLMLTVAVNDVQEFRKMVLDKNLPKRFGIRMGEVTVQTYGKEVNIIDRAGVCWLFVE